MSELWTFPNKIGLGYENGEINWFSCPCQNTSPEAEEYKKTINRFKEVKENFICVDETSDYCINLYSEPWVRYVIYNQELKKQLKKVAEEWGHDLDPEEEYLEKEFEIPNLLSQSNR